MKPDISRPTFKYRNHYNRVIMQQGRVQLEADWNEQQDILLHRLNTQTSDTTGQGNVSADNNGFAVMFTPDKKDLVIMPGYIYVGGLLCELEQEMAIPVLPISVEDSTISIRRQDLDDVPFKKKRWVNHWIELLDNYERRLGLYKIINVDDQDQQIILSFDQPFPNNSDDIVKIRLVTTYLTQPNYPQPDPRLQGLQLETPHHTHVILVYLDVWERPIDAFTDPDIVEVALGGADTALRSQVVGQVKLVLVKITSEELLEAIKQHTELAPESEHQKAHERRLRNLLRVFTFTPPFSEWTTPYPPYTGRLSVRLSPTSGDDARRYRGLENQLYHVEIHEGSTDKDTPTFKWARNNASSLVAVTIKDGQVKVAGSGQGNLLGLTVGQYVELLDESTELLALPGHIAQIKQVNDITGLLTLDPPPPEDAKQNRLRLWNAYAPIDGSKNVQVSEDGWIAIESGIEIQFSRGTTYRSGDYWLIPARTATGKIDWPHNTPQLPVGIEHHYTRLTCLLHTHRITLQQDCRKHFFPLATQALHVLDINWRNDVLYEGEAGHRLLREGLHITLDGPPDQAYAKAMQAAMIVTAETALPGGGAGIFLISGHFEIHGNIIKWHWHREEKEGLLANFFSGFDKFRSRLFERHPHRLRIRIQLKGDYIWHTHHGRPIYLDGQAFGIPGTEEASGYKPIPEDRERMGKHIDLHFPSGTGRPASDFESWFYMEE